MSLIGLLIDWTPLRKKKSLSLSIPQSKLPKLKSTEKKTEKKQSRISKDCGTTTKDVTNKYIIGKPKGRKTKEQKKIFEEQ